MHPLVAAILAAGGGGPAVQLEGISASGNAISGNPSATLTNTGDATSSPPPTVEFQWLLAGSASDYEAMVDNVVVGGSGGTFTGTTLTWLSLGTSRSWGLSGTPAALSDASARLRIRRASSTVLATCTLTFDYTG